MDFIHPEFNAIINGNLKPIHPSAVVPNMLIAESEWFSPDHGQVGHYLRDVFKNYKNYTDGAKRQAYRSKNEFSWDKMKEKLNNILSTNIPEFPKQIELKLPDLKLPTF